MPRSRDGFFAGDLSEGQKPIDVTVQATQEVLEDTTELFKRRKEELEAYARSLSEVLPLMNSGLEVQFISPADLKFSELHQDISKKGSRVFTADPEMQLKDPAQLVATSLNMIHNPDPKIWALLADVTEDYKSENYMPGIEYLKWLEENPALVPQQLTDGRWYLFPGTIFRASTGKWAVCLARWNSKKWSITSIPIDREWSSNNALLLVRDTLAPPGKLKS